MLTIVDSNGIDLVATPPAVRALLASTNGGAPFTISVKVIETDSTLPLGIVSGTLSWNDGSIPNVYTDIGTAVIDAFSNLMPGAHVVSVSARNFRAPQSDEAQVNYFIIVTAPNQQAAPSRIIFGPILPRDTGFPNASQWNFTTDSDASILESSLKMLFITAKGERIQQPDYGTNLRRIVFDPNVQGIEGLVNQEIVDAVTKWEPRVQLAAVNVVRNENNSVTIQASFNSKLTQQLITVAVTLNP